MPFILLEAIPICPLQTNKMRFIDNGRRLNDSHMDKNCEKKCVSIKCYWHTQ